MGRDESMDMGTVREGWMNKIKNIHTLYEMLKELRKSIQINIYKLGKLRILLPTNL